MKNSLDISSFYTNVLKIIIICYTVPEIWHVTDVIIFHFGLFFNLLPANSPNKKNSQKWKSYWRYHHFTLVYQKSLLYVMLFLRYGVWWVQLFFILGNLCPYTLLTAQKMKISKKWKKHLEISSFYTSDQKSWSYVILFLRYGMWHI